MRRNARCFLLRFAAALAVLLAFSQCTVAAAGPDSLDELRGQLQKQIVAADVKSFAVADFLTPDGKPSDLGWYLAAKLSDGWLEPGQGFRVQDRGELTNTKVTAEDARTPAALQQVGRDWAVVAIVTGTVEPSADHYAITANVLRVSDGSVVATASQNLPHSRILDLLSPQGVGEDGASSLRGGINGTGLPSCLFCPAPAYSGKASRARLQSTVLLSVTISADGRTAKISILKNPGYGLTEIAIETVSGWKFRPALGKEGKPVPVIVPVEVAFRMTRS
jgi:periplasmic protein TonB